MSPFHQVLVNTLLANVTNFTVWFALTFWVYLQTQSVFATGMIAGLYLVMTAGLAFWFGGLVDNHGKKRMMMASSLASAAFYALGAAVLFAAPDTAFARVDSPALWALVVLVMTGVIAGNIRSIALPTLVTALVPAERRDSANGLVGVVTGIGFLTTSVISGLLVAWGGMTAAFVFALALTSIALVQLAFVRIDEGRVAAADAEGAPAPRPGVDIRGTIRVIAAVPGLFALILFSTFNNFLGGVFMALMDPYGLSMMRVEQWGLLWGVVSVAFILSGLVIARTGLGSNPLRTLMLANLAVWAVAAVFTVQASILLMTAGLFLWLFIGPYVEAAEQTTLQRVVPYERQGRVFGLAQSVEQAASPLTAFLIGPPTQFVVIPFMTDGWGAAAIGGWFGTGPARGMALVFTTAGLIGIAATVIAFNSPYYRRLSAAYARPLAGAPA